LCIHGDKQIEGINYTDKYAPGASWATVSMLMILMVREMLHIRLIDFTNVFAQAKVKETVYAEQPRVNRWI